ncbi:phytoene/squalene synthase family protein [Bacillus horti]|uniref:Phytoene synthase n=1 Tax=Caldalkalibacillus horti TaxID=77523 RepID=A0ABT9W221_9BACI|nr:phytoene/squalene synthase family protein [Bacillus horti]MDQ0167303.1 phytoene synthase [Bacillus horti]
MKLPVYLQSCERMIRKGSTSFHKAFAFLPSPKKEAVHVIYAFCRLIDDSVDEPEKSPFTIDELENGLRQLDQAQGHFIWPALRWLFDTFPVSKTPFYRQMEGQRRDLILTHYETMEQLDEYCYLVAGTVGEMLMPVLHDQPNQQIIESGVSLGKAMQIVNIIRDVGEDLERGRRYLPLNLLRSFGYTEDMLEQKMVNHNLVQVIQYLEVLARQSFEEGLKDLDAYPASSAFSVELAARFYEAILLSVERNQYDVFTKRAYVNQAQKVKIYHSVKKHHEHAMKNEESSAVS